jgi:hypothetical protein
MRNFYSGIVWTPNPEFTKKCPLKTGFAVHSKSDSLSSQFRNPCPVQNGIGVQYTPDFASRRIFVHSETDLCSEDLRKLKVKAKEFGHDLQFRAEKFRMEKSMYEHPLAFISHDSRDKDEVAKKIAIKLQSMRCPVWYDDFALKIGDNLRDSIEKGLKECKKCILILSPHFLSNNGWTKREFDSIFTREILEESNLVLPVWYGVTKKDVYEYSPSLLNVKGTVWETTGAEEVCRQLYNAIMS